MLWAVFDGVGLNNTGRTRQQCTARTHERDARGIPVFACAQGTRGAMGRLINLTIFKHKRAFTRGEVLRGLKENKAF